MIGGLEINEDTVEVTMDGNWVKLTPIEYKICFFGKESGKSLFIRRDLRKSMAGKGN